MNEHFHTLPTPENRTGRRTTRRLSQTMLQSPTSNPKRRTMPAPTTPDLHNFLTHNRYACATRLPNNTIAFVHPSTYGQAQLGISPDANPNSGVTDRYTYRSLSAAIAALAAWEHRGFLGEPQGWHRHQPSNRRRTHGDATREYIAP